MNKLIRRVTVNEFFTRLQDVSAVELIVICAAVAVLWFLPAILAMIFNRKQAKLIALACIPAGFSVIAWTAVLLWSVTGKAVEKYLPAKIKKQLA